MAFTFSTRMRDCCGGGLMIMLGLGAVVQGRRYDVGTLQEMGPGFFPVAVGAILAVSGCITAWHAGRTLPRSADAENYPPEWRGWFCIIASLIAFMLLASTCGLLPATFAVGLIAALGDRMNTIWNALALAIGLCVICVIVFWWALKIQMPLFRWG